MAWKDSVCPQDLSAFALTQRCKRVQQPRLTRTWVGREQQLMNLRIKLGLAAASAAALALSACGSNSLGGQPGGAESAPSVSVSQNADLASKLPESIKSAGVINIGVDSS